MLPRLLRAYSAAATPPTTPPPPGYFRITLHRSANALPYARRRILRSLGLRKRSSVSFVPRSPAAAGAILKVKELVRVELAETKVTRRVRAESGYEVVGNLLRP